MNSRRTSSCSARRSAIALYAAARSRSSAGPSSGTRTPQLALGHPPSRVRDALERPREPPGEEHRDPDRQRGRDERRDAEHDRDALVEHRVGVVGAVAGGHHQRRERGRPDPEHPDRDDASTTAATSRDAARNRTQIRSPDGRSLTGRVPASPGGVRRSTGPAAR